MMSEIKTKMYSLDGIAWYQNHSSAVRIRHDVVWLASAQHLVHASTAGNKHAGVVVVAVSTEVDVDSSTPPFPSPPLVVNSIARAARMESTHETNVFCSIGHFSWHTLSLVELDSPSCMAAGAAAAVLPLSIAWVFTVEKGHIGIYAAG